MKFPTLRSPAPLAAACAWTLFLAPCARACAQATQVQPAPAQAAPAQQADRSERWYSVEMMGGKAGWMQSITIRAADTITTRTKIHFSLARGVEGADITIASEFVETPAGKAVSMRTVQKMGLMDVEQNYRFLEDGVEVTSK